MNDEVCRFLRQRVTVTAPLVIAALPSGLPALLPPASVNCVTAVRAETGAERRGQPAPAKRYGHEALPARPSGATALPGPGDPQGPGQNGCPVGPAAASTLSFLSAQRQRRGGLLATFPTENEVRIKGVCVCKRTRTTPGVPWGTASFLPEARWGHRWTWCPSPAPSGTTFSKLRSA